jgi:oligopeptide/dipeptide ABC transporter ATP-binding protein
MEKLIEVQNVRKYFPVRRGFFSRGQVWLKAVDGVSFEVGKAEIFGLAGESGCGKTTVGRLLVRLEDPSEGHIYLQGEDIGMARGRELKKFRKDVQMIFQDPYESLNPRLTVSDTVVEPLKLQNIGSESERESRVVRALKEVGLSGDFLPRYPNELSGGQRQRVAIARALVVDPKFIVADEPCSMLDVSIRAEILNIILRLRDELKSGFLYITHDLAEAMYVTNMLGIMYLGKLVESGRSEEVIGEPLHPYTKALIASMPVANPEVERERIRLKGEIPKPIAPPPGCRFHPRCPIAVKVCEE